MPQVKAKVIANNTNCSIVQIDNRAFPGVLIQGDSLYSLYTKADKLFNFIENLGEDHELYEQSEFLRDSLKEYLLVYENCLNEHNQRLPYNREN